MKQIFLVVVKHALAFALKALRRNPSSQRASPLLAPGFVPKRVLLLNGAHIGDVVVSTSLIPILRSAWPDVEIGFLTGSWSSAVVANHSEVAYNHCVDHWFHNRDKISLYKKVAHYRASRRKVLKEIQDVGYEVAVSLHPFFPDFLDLSFAARVPIRVAFSKSLFAPLATAVAECSDNPFTHQGAVQAELLRVLPIAKSHFCKRKSSLGPSDVTAIREVCSVLRASHIEDVQYSIIHIGSGAPHRELPLKFWRELAAGLSTTNILLFTGRGSHEAESVELVTEGLSNCINGCDRLSWKGFVAAVRHAEVVYGVESMAGHVAAAVGTESVVVYTGTAGVARWRPEANSTVFTNHVPCAPCFKPSGCAAMTCLNEIRPRDLIIRHAEDSVFSSPLA